MTEGWAIGLLGVLAGLCTTGSLIPQVVKVWRDGETDAISVRMYVAISVAFVLWLGYGLTIGSWPMIVFNLMNLALGGVILILKIRGNRSQAPRPASSSLEAEAP